VRSSANLGRKRSAGLRANLLLAVAAAFGLQAILCPALCAARSAESTALHRENASAPEKAPCHGTNEAPSRDQTSEDCNGKCGRIERVELAPASSRTVLDAPATAVEASFFLPAPSFDSAPVANFESAPSLPPRHLLLVKNSFLI